MAEVPETEYAQVPSGSHVAYQLVGDGPMDVLVHRPTIFPVDLMWEEPRLAYFLNRLSSFCRHIWFDPRGTGASDSISHEEGRLVESNVDDGLAVLDAVGSRQVAILGLTGATGLLFAAAHPERTSALVIVNGTARYRYADGYPQGLSDGEVDDRRERGGPGSKGHLAVMAPSLIDDARAVRWFARAGRLTVRPEDRLWRLGLTFDTDLRDVLGAIRAPTLVVNRRDRRIADQTRYVADHIGGAKYVELDGVDSAPFAGDAEPVLDAIEEFLTGQLAPAPADRVLATVLFTDLVSSTPRVERMGDRRWRNLIATHDAMVRSELDRFRGREVRFDGDGVLATFDGPGRAIRCACAIRDALAALGLEVRAGLHTGEIELRGDDIAGIAVHVGKRVSTQATAGEVLVSRTVADLVAGSDIELHDKGEHELKGVSGTWRLFSVASA